MSFEVVWSGIRRQLRKVPDVVKVVGVMGSPPQLLLADIHAAGCAGEWDLPLRRLLGAEGVEHVQEQHVGARRANARGHHPISC